MTTYNDKTALAQSPTTFTALYPISSHTNHKWHHQIKEPEGEYSASSSPDSSSSPKTTTPSINTLQDRLEQHLARYHFHHLSLMAIGCGEEDSEHWEFGAYLTGRGLQRESEALIKELSQLKLSTATQ